jgi:hypothetical protein
MTRTARLALLSIPLAVGALSASLPSGAQPAGDARFAFADSTLLRDTLGLHFGRLFPLADSLRMVPDTLRAISVRLLFDPERVVQLADSLDVPVDSVAVVLRRERSNPLASGQRSVSRFSYSTSYNVQQTSSTWSNTSDYSLGFGPMFLNNSTSIQANRYQTGARTSIRQTRSSTTETGWKLTPDYSIGGRAVLTRFDSDDPGTIRRIGETQNEFQFSIRTRQQPSRNVSSEVNLFSGLLDLSNQAQEKAGLTGDLNGRLRVTSGTWLVNELNGQVTGNSARTRPPGNPSRFDTQDFSRNLRGSMNLFEGSKVGLNSSYGLVDSRVEILGDSGTVRPVRTKNSNLSTLLRLQARGFDVNFGPSFGTSEQATAQLDGQSSRSTHGVAGDGRYALRGWTLEGRFATNLSSSELPHVTAAGGYGEDIRTRNLEGTLSGRLSTRLNARVNGRIALTRYRYHVVGTYTTPPLDRDQVQQSYRVEGIYRASQRLNGSLALDVSRTQLVNIPSASTSANNLLRTYRAEWHWTYRLSRGLTATQVNTVSANYTGFTFMPQNDRLAMDYSTVTTLNAVLSPQLSVDLSHSAQLQPSGNYGLGPDGLSYFSPADRSKNYWLDSRISYRPSQAITLFLEPSFRSAERSGTLSGQTVPQREDRNLDFSGSTHLNVPVGKKGLLSGNIGRTYRAGRQVTFASGVPVPSPLSQYDFWNGSLQFSWKL